jgi:hypothetical protein
MADPVLDVLRAEAGADSGTLGLLLAGSRAAGLGDDASDYDVVWVLTGELPASLERIAAMPEERADAEAYEAYDAYLNAFVRSTRTWERGDELGARLHAAESVAYLVRALHALERRWPPYHDRLASQLRLLEPQGWEPGYLEETLLELVRTGDPALQRELESRVERLMESRGVLAHREWGQGLERARRGP